MNVEEFVSAAAAIGVDQAVARTFYDVITSSFRVKGLELDADLSKRYGIVDDELDDVVMTGAKRLGRVLPTPAQTRGMPPVRTVADLLRFVQGMKSGA